MEIGRSTFLLSVDSHLLLPRKMNPASLTDAIDLARALVSASSSLRGEAIVFPPAPFISAVSDVISSSAIHLGAQAIYYEDSGAYTGAISAYVLCFFCT